MKTKPNLALAVGALLLAALTGSMKASPISIADIISFSGSPKGDHGKVKNAAKFKKSGTITVSEAGTLSVDCAGTVGSAVANTPFTQGSVGANLPIKPLWNFGSSGNKHAFKLGSLGVDFHSPTAQVLSGFGKPSITGPVMKKSKTQSLVNPSGQKPGKPGLPSSTHPIVPLPATNHVPDGGTSALLLGLSVWGFGWLKRKSAA